MTEHTMTCECLIGRDAICRWLKISKTTFYRLVRQGLPVRRQARTWVANCRDLNAWSQTPIPRDALRVLACQMVERVKQK